MTKYRNGNHLSKLISFLVPNEVKDISFELAFSILNDLLIEPPNQQLNLIPVEKLTDRQSQAH